MTVKFDCFVHALRQLCEIHEINLFCTVDGLLSVEDSHGSYISPDMEDLTERVEE